MAAGISQQARKREKQVPQAAAQWASARQDVTAQLPNSAQLMASQTGQDGSIYADALKAKFMQHQLPSAEREADRIAAGIHASTPEQVKAQLGEKMGADFSAVRFHTDGAAAGQADTMGARAFTTGRDVYFGQGGFDAGVAAHELVHTVQQGSVAADMGTVSAPAGEVQMKPETGNWFSRTNSWLYNKTFGKLARSHKRAMTDFIQSRDDGTWRDVPWWRKAQYILTHPWAYGAGYRSKNIKRVRDESRWDNEDALAVEYLKMRQAAAQKAAAAQKSSTAKKSSTAQKAVAVQPSKEEWMPDTPKLIPANPAAPSGQQQAGSRLETTARSDAEGRDIGEEGFYPQVWDAAMENMTDDDALLNVFPKKNTTGSKATAEDEEEAKWYEKSLLNPGKIISRGKDILDTTTSGLGVTRALGGVWRNAKGIWDSRKSGVRGSTTSAWADMGETLLEGASNGLDAAKSGLKLYDWAKGLSGEKSLADGLGDISGTKDTTIAGIMNNGDKAGGLNIGNIFKGASAVLKFGRGFAEMAHNWHINRRTKKLNESWSAKRKQLEENKKNSIAVTPEEEKTAKIMDQSSYLARKNAKARAVRGGFRMLDAAADVGTMANPIPILGTVLSKVQQGIGALGEGIASSATKNANIKLLNEEMDLDEKIEEFAKQIHQKREQQKNQKSQTRKQKSWNEISETWRDDFRRTAKHAILKAYGFTTGKRSEAVGNLILDRSKYLTEHANDANKSAHKDAVDMMKAMGVHRRKDGKDKVYRQDDVATQMGLDGGEEGLEKIRKSRASALKGYKSKSFWQSLGSFFFGDD